jgi:molybdate-binding protein
VKGIRSPAQRVADGKADVGLGLHTAVQTHDVDFVPIGNQRLVVLGAPARQGKAGLETVASVLSGEGAALAGEMAGYDFDD